VRNLRIHDLKIIVVSVKKVTVVLKQSLAAVCQ